MKFWDTSAVAPLLLNEPASAAMIALRREDPRMAVWWLTEVECVSAVSRRQREGAIDMAAASFALERLDALMKQWEEVLPDQAVRTLARRLLRVHPLRAADASQLAAALVLNQWATVELQFVSLDGRLVEAALREGLRAAPHPA